MGFFGSSLLSFVFDGVCIPLSRSVGAAGTAHWTLSLRTPHPPTILDYAFIIHIQTLSKIDALPVSPSHRPGS